MAFHEITEHPETAKLLNNESTPFTDDHQTAMEMALIEVLRSATRPAIEDAISILVGILDEVDGDPDREPNGDESEDSENGMSAVDQFGNSAGILIIPGSDEDDEPIGDELDGAWTEWQSRGRHKVNRFGSELFDPAGEDREDDDRDAEHNGLEPEEDKCTAGDDDLSDFACGWDEPTEDDEFNN